MTFLLNFLRSLLVTVVFSFVAPIFLVGGILLLLSVLGYMPGLQTVTETSATGILHFLAIFGSGTPLRGMLIIGLTWSFVGALFDTYAYYRCQILRIDS
ncbi:hypothetical protein NIES2109_42550 [Nostoc sp. HK-01]|uniref:Binding-protein-dependent transport systems inner membrane component n=2 Tax=Nostocales TaxID=1161 RepID=A0A1Z4GAA1_9CYAN|nr:hypothetical protein [Nostoc cycadae]BAY14407.1 hypothetical protein NIES21_01640 [Anabaenopsis circularis NIES-21]BBD61427.1 hypothetical protein NIES2109_42550 [Nostoc sp. HK-01]GBE92107.1 hypothetical protein NCWK1_1861 [Nostoc cycadae WK-1]